MRKRYKKKVCLRFHIDIWERFLAKNGRHKVTKLLEEFMKSNLKDDKNDQE